MATNDQKGKKQFHGKRPCRVVREVGADVVIQYTDDAGGFCRVSESNLTEKPMSVPEDEDDAALQAREA